MMSTAQHHASRTEVQMRFPPPAASSSSRMRAAVAALLVCAAGGACTLFTDPIDRSATFSGRWGGDPWAGDAGATILVVEGRPDSLFVTGSSPVNAQIAPREMIHIRVPFRGTGTYALDASAVELWELLGGDVLTASYGGVGTPAGTLEITSYGGPGGVVEGTVSFVARSTSPHAARGTGTVRFERGRFRAPVHRWPEAAEGGAARRSR
jgi:hypothetical protein